MKVICNKCGYTFNYATEVEVQYEYGSKFDMETWSMNICDSCAEEIVKTFAVLPQGYGVTGYEEYHKALNQVYNGGLI